MPYKALSCTVSASHLPLDIPFSLSLTVLHTSLLSHTPGITLLPSYPLIVNNLFPENSIFCTKMLMGSLFPIVLSGKNDNVVS